MFEFRIKRITTENETANEKKAICFKTTSSKFYRGQCINTNWNHRKLSYKLNQITKVVSSLKRKLPDILALAEVENGKGRVLRISKV